jgi:hypothetical protein
MQVARCRLLGLLRRALTSGCPGHIIRFVVRLGA